MSDDNTIAIFLPIGLFFGMSVLGTLIRICHTRYKWHQSDFGYTGSYSKDALWRLVKSSKTIGRSVHQADIGLFKVTGHKFLYPDKVPIDPNFFQGLMTIEQFTQIMTIINTIVIDSLDGQHQAVMGRADEDMYSECYAAADFACRQATDYLQQNGVRAVVFQTIEHESRRYEDGRYWGTTWDTSINISFRDEDILRVQAPTIGGVPVIYSNNTSPSVLAHHSAIPVAAAVVAHSGGQISKSEFPNLSDPHALKIAQELKMFYNRLELNKPYYEIEASANWALLNGVDALNEKLREKYDGQDLATNQKIPPV